jgi:feruloyl esterase
MAADQGNGSSPASAAARGGRTIKFALSATVVLAALASGGATQTAATASPTQAVQGLEGLCNADTAQAVAATLGTRVTVQKIENGAFPSATRYVAAAGTIPAYCQVAGSFVTNPATGKTANFLATFPANWNGKYLQLGCSGHCGQFYVSNPAVPSVTVTAQGHAGQILEKGYATFATDEGHIGMDPAKWAIRKDGTIDQDFLDDFYYRADRVLADMGKAFTTAFYAHAKGAPQKIARSYFNGCSGGGRDAMVTASYFPEKFDGIIGGSPYDPLGMGVHNGGSDLAAARSPATSVSPALFDLFDKVVQEQCDGVDGVKDGVIQNPMACNFRPDRDLPRCEGDKAGGQCFTSGQIESLSAMVSAATDENGNVLAPGMSISELQARAGIGGLGDALRKVFVHKNDPNYKPSDGFSFRTGGPGPISSFHTVYPRAEYLRIKNEIRLGAGHLLENSNRIMTGKTKFLIWHNLSDERLTPYSSVNYYRGLARKHGGYANVQKNVRMFLLPATAHCSIVGKGPNGFDALTTMENWVERGIAPQSLRLFPANRQFSPGAAPAAVLRTPNWTGLACKFPEMARYNGRGDVKDAANWSCSPTDKRMLTIGETGRLAGIIN